MILLLLLFTVVPAIELYALLQLGAWMGALNTFLLVVTTGVIGSWLAKREGLGVLLQLRSELEQGMPPGERVLEGVMVFVGGLLLVTPGVFTDLAGFLLIVGPTRRLLAPAILSWITRNVDIRVSDGRYGQPGFPPGVGLPPGAGLPRGHGQPPRSSVSSSDSDKPTPFSNKFDDLP